MTSSWIDSIQYNDSSSSATMTLTNGNCYDIAPMDRKTFSDWEGNKPPPPYFMLAIF